MSLFFKAIQSAIASRDGRKKWFPSLVKLGNPVSTRKVAKALASLTTLNEGDVYNVLVALSPVLFNFLLQSRAVKLEGLGTFTLRATSKGNGVDNSDEVTPKQINYLRVQFTPEYTRPLGVGKTRSQFEDVEYVRWDVNKSLSDNNDDDDDDGYEQDPNA